MHTYTLSRLHRTKRGRRIRSPTMWSSGSTRSLRPNRTCASSLYFSDSIRSDLFALRLLVVVRLYVYSTSNAMCTREIMPVLNMYSIVRANGTLCAQFRMFKPPVVPYFFRTAANDLLIDFRLLNRGTRTVHYAVHCLCTVRVEYCSVQYVYRQC